MSSIAKLRHEFKKEKALMNKMIADAGDDMIRKPVAAHGVPLPAPVHHHVKLTIDPIKLEKTIKKACIPIEKKSIVVLETIPPVAAASAVAHKKPIVVAVCQARNLNGTPCKCKAKVGKFCAKHS